MSFSHVASLPRSVGRSVWSMLEKEQREERREGERVSEGGREGRKRGSVRSFVVCEYDYISIDACIVQFGERGMATGVTTFIWARWVGA